MSEETLYERLGGRESIAAVVDEFYDGVMADDRAHIDISEFVFADSNAMMMAFGSKASESGDGSDAAAQNETASDGERFFNIKFADGARNVNSVAGITG